MKAIERRDEAGLTILEYIIALIIVMVAFVTWLSLTSTGVRNGVFVKKLADVKWLSSQKAAELSDKATVILKQIPQTEQKIGSIAPNKAEAGYFDLLDETGNLITDESGSIGTARYIRQWMIVKNFPVEGNISIYVSVSYKATNKVIRLAKVIKTDGL
jgi:hypothetical protein